MLMQIRLWSALVALLFLLPAKGWCAAAFYADYGTRNFDVTPGQHITGSINVTSMSSEEITLKVYSGVQVRSSEALQDYPIEENGETEPRSLLPWLTFTPNELTLQPKETKQVLFEVNVPSDNSLTGSYWANILVANEPTTEDIVQQTEKPKEATVGIKFIFRYAIRITATFPAPRTVDGTITDVSVEADSHEIRMLPVFENKGNIILRPKVWIEAHDLTGKKVASSEPKDTMVLPESKRILLTTLDNVNLPAGEYLLTVVADYGGPKPVGARARVKLDKAITPKPANADDEAGPEPETPPGEPAEASEDSSDESALPPGIPAEPSKDGH